jgi:hypothetical protein
MRTSIRRPIPPSGAPIPARSTSKPSRGIAIAMRCDIFPRSERIFALANGEKSLGVAHDRNCGLPCRRSARYGNGDGKNPHPKNPPTSPIDRVVRTRGDVTRNVSNPTSNMD